MTVRALSTLKKFPGFGAETASTGSASRALIFVLDLGYLRPMKVLLHTLASTGSLLDLPVIIATKDRRLFEDPVINAVADIKFLIEREALTVLEDAAANAQKRKGKHAWTRATFLKWVIFRDWGFDELLFLDCDMIALGAPAALFDEPGDIVGAPQFKGVLLRNAQGIERDRGAICERLERFAYRLGGSPLSLNSGVMVLRRKVLSPEFLEELIAFTRTITCVNEQQFITQFAKSRESAIRLNFISPIYNFQEGFLAKLSPSNQMRFLRDIRILHYAGGGKPWKQQPTIQTSIGCFLWWKAHAEADAYLRLSDQGAASMSKRFNGSSAYWETRYRSGGDSGKGSYGELAQFKAQVLNDFVAEQKIRTVAEFGCGDGNQLSLARYEKYVGYDVSPTALEMCRKMFSQDPSKEFLHVRDYSGQKADLALSLDVLFHLTEDEVFDDYMRRLFEASGRYVAIYGSNVDRAINPKAPHVRHRRFQTWVADHAPDFRLMRKVPNRFRGETRTAEGYTSPSDFYFYEKLPRGE